MPPLRGWRGDGAYGLRDRPDTAGRSAYAPRSHTRRSIRALRPRAAGRPLHVGAKVQDGPPLARTRSLHPLHRDARSAVALATGCGLLPVHRHGAHLDLRHCNMPLAPTLDSDDFRYSQELLVGQKIAFLGLLRVDMGV